MERVESNSEEVQKKKKGGKKQIAFERMRIAVEKLQLARAKVTITLTMIGFGCYKIFYDRVEHGKTTLSFPNGRDIGIILIVTGFVILILAVVQHHRSLSKLRSQHEGMHTSLSLVFSYFILAFSTLLFVIVIFRL